MNTQKKWFAVYTRPRWEKKVAELLSRRNIENYCPLNKVVRQWSDRKKVIYEPLFTSYVFIHATELEHLAIRQVDGILNFVYWLGKPAVIRDEEISTIRHFLADYSNVRLETVDINLSDRVRITNGPLISLEGNVMEVKSKSVKIVLPSLGYAMVAEVEKTNVEVLRPAGVSTYAANFLYNGAFR